MASHKHVSLGTYNEFRIPPHGNDCPVHCPEKFLHDDLDMPLSWPLEGRDINQSQERRPSRFHKPKRLLPNPAALCRVNQL